jgi:hypothetical protein
MAWLSYTTSGPFATAGRLLAQLACGYYFVIVASTGLSDNLGFKSRHDQQQHAQHIADLVLLWDLLRRLTDVILIDGFRRSVGDVVDKWSADQFSLFLHACSLVNLQVRQDNDVNNAGAHVTVPRRCLQHQLLIPQTTRLPTHRGARCSTMLRWIFCQRASQ